MIVIRTFSFDAAHYVPCYHGKCENLHGHTYKLVVKVDGKCDSEGMVIDFAELKKIVKDNVVDKFDHHCLNDIISVPTAENISVYVWQKLQPLLQNERYHLAEVQIWETANNGCVYRGEAIA